jgi:hypothetical protein
MWMSEAPRLIASVRIRLTSLTTGRFLGLGRERLDVELFFVLENLEIRGIRALEVFHDLLELDRRGCAVVVVDRSLDAELGRHHGLDVVAGHELDVVHGEHVGRVRHRDRDGRAGLVDRQDVVLARDVGGDQLDHARVDLEVREVDRRDAELLRQALGDVLLGDETELDRERLWTEFPAPSEAPRGEHSSF